MSEIQQGRYDALLRRVADLKGPGSKVNDVLEELFPTLDVENVPSELLRLMGTKVAFAGGTNAALAGQAGKAQVFNPAGSSKLITITSAHFACNAVVVVRWGLSAVSFGAQVATEVFRDTRDLSPAAPTGQFHQTNAVALASATNQARVLANTDLQIIDENDVCVLAPGTGFEWGAGTNNADTWFAVSWRERVAEPSELNL